MKYTGIICGEHTYLSQLGFAACTEINISNIDEADINSINAMYDKLIVLCELKSGSISLDRFYGFNVVRMLRLKGAQMPILFISMMPVAGLLEMQNIFAKLLLTNGHGFIQLPAEVNEIETALENLKPLSSRGLTDIQFFYCSPEGLIDELLHSYKDNSNKSRDEHIKLLKELCQIAQKSENEYLEEFINKYPSEEKFEQGDAFNFINSIGKKFINDLKSKTDAQTLVGTSPQEKPWSLLVLDDELNGESPFIQKIKEKGITVICTSNATDALDKIYSDNASRGRIALILCDYRLLEVRDGIQGFHQAKQGYTFLQEIGDDFRSRLFSAIVYSALPRRFLLETFKDYNLRTEIFSKIDFPPDNSRQTEYLIDRIVEIGDNNYDSMLALPRSSEGWKKHLDVWYEYFRKKPDYTEINKKIDSYCNKWIINYEQKINPETPLATKSVLPNPINIYSHEKIKDILNEVIDLINTRSKCEPLKEGFKEPEETLINIINVWLNTYNEAKNAIKESNDNISKENKKKNEKFDDESLKDILTNLKKTIDNRNIFEKKSKDIFNNTENTLKDNAESWINVFNILQKENSSLTHDVYDNKIINKYFDKFLSILKTRRIAQYLYLKFEAQRKTDSQEAVFDIIDKKNDTGSKTNNKETENTDEEKEKKQKENRQKQIMNVVLGLCLNDYPLGATIEEIYWMNMHEKIITDYQNLRRRFNSIEDTISVYLNNTNLMEQYKKEYDKDGVIIYNKDDFKNIFKWLKDNKKDDENFSIFKNNLNNILNKKKFFRNIQFLIQNFINKFDLIKNSVKDNLINESLKIDNTEIYFSKDYNPCFNQISEVEILWKYFNNLISEKIEEKDLSKIRENLEKLKSDIDKLKNDYANGN